MVVAPVAGTIKLLAVSEKARVFGIAIHFSSCLIFVGKARRPPCEWSLVRFSTLVGSNLASKY